MISQARLFAFFFESVYTFMFFFFAIQYIIIKKKEYLCYALYLCLLSLYYIVALPDAFFGVSMANATDVAAFDLYKRPLQFLSSVLYTLFIMYYLGLEKVDSYLYRFFKVLLAMYLFMAALCFSLNFLHINYDSYYYIFSMLLFPLQLYVVIALFKHKVKYSNFIIWGSIITLVGSSLTLTYYIYLMRFHANDPDANTHSYIPVQVSILLDIFLFTIALQQKIADNEKALITAATARQQAILLERERIIADLHDDVGGGLSSIRMMSDLMLQQGQKEALPAYVTFGEKISLTAKDIAQRMHTIIWSLNTENDTIENFAEYVRQYGVGFFENAGIKFNAFHLDSLPANTQISGVKRKNLFLITKEAFHNILKHSAASEASVSITAENDMLQIIIADNGKGISESGAPTAIRFGNGLKNMQKRMDEINGTLKFEASAGTTITLSVMI